MRGAGYKPSDLFGRAKGAYTTIYDFNAIRQHCAIAKSNEVSCASIAFFDERGNFISTRHLLSLEYSTSRPSQPTAGISYVLDPARPSYVLHRGKCLLMDALCGPRYSLEGVVGPQHTFHEHAKHNFHHRLHTR